MSIYFTGLCIAISSGATIDGRTVFNPLLSNRREKQLNSDRQGSFDEFNLKPTSNHVQQKPCIPVRFDRNQRSEQNTFAYNGKKLFYLSRPSNTYQPITMNNNGLSAGNPTYNPYGGYYCDNYQNSIKPTTSSHPFWTNFANLFGFFGTNNAFKPEAISNNVRPVYENTDHSNIVG